MPEPNLPISENINSTAKSSTNSFPIEIFRGLGKVMNEVGIIGFIVLSIVVFIFLYPDKNKKDEIIDSWLLFKNGNSQFILITLILLIIIISQQIHYKNVIKLRDERINELANKKNSNYSKSLSQSLSSSVKNQKP